MSMSSPLHDGEPRGKTPEVKPDSLYDGEHEYAVIPYDSSRTDSFNKMLEIEYDPGTDEDTWELINGLFYNQNYPTLGDFIKPNI